MKATDISTLPFYISTLIQNFVLLKRPKTPLNFFFLSHPFCDCTTLPLILIFSLSSIFSFYSPSVLHSLSSIFFPFLCAPVFIKPNRWVSAQRSCDVGLGLEELQHGSRPGGVATWVSIWRGDGVRSYGVGLRPGGATVDCIGLEQADLGLTWKFWFWFCLLEQADLRSENFGFVCWRVLLDGEEDTTGERGERM